MHCAMQGKSKEPAVVHEGGDDANAVATVQSVSYVKHVRSSSPVGSENRVNI